MPARYRTLVEAHDSVRQSTQSRASRLLGPPLAQVATNARLARYVVRAVRAGERCYSQIMPFGHRIAIIVAIDLDGARLRLVGRT